MTDADDVVCLRCGGRAESGFVAAGAGKGIRWSTGDRRAAVWLGWGEETLARPEGFPAVLLGLTRVAAHRCRPCRLVWFES